MFKDSWLKLYVKVRGILSNEQGQALAEYGLILIAWYVLLRYPDWGLKYPLK